MSVSIYYAARRHQPLTPAEQAAIDRIHASYSIRDHVEQHVQTGLGHNGENFRIYDPGAPIDPGTIFEGATKLPDNSEDAFAELLQHWCELLSEVRRVVRGAEWRVHLDDYDIHWDEGAQAFDPFA